jgi:hypothetical protein
MAFENVGLPPERLRDLSRLTLRHRFGGPFGLQYDFRMEGTESRFWLDANPHLSGTVN